MTRRMVRNWTLMIASGALIAACGGSDDEPAAAPAAASDDASGDASDGASGDDGAGDESAGDDGSGAGSNDEAQETLDDLGVDMDLDELEETVKGFSSGEGGGVVTINGEAYAFEATGVCLVQGTDFVAEGLGAAPDGTPAWVSINHTFEDFDDDGTETMSVDVFVEVGKTELFGSGADDQPSWAASYYEGFGDDSRAITAELSGTSISGSGPISDYNGIAIPFGETAEMTFEANCG